MEQQAILNAAGEKIESLIGMYLAGLVTLEELQDTINNTMHNVPRAGLIDPPTGLRYPKA